MRFPEVSSDGFWSTSPPAYRLGVTLLDEGADTGTVPSPGLTEPGALELALRSHAAVRLQLLYAGLNLARMGFHSTPCIFHKCVAQAPDSSEGLAWQALPFFDVEYGHAV